MNRRFLKRFLIILGLAVLLAVLWFSSGHSSPKTETRRENAHLSGVEITTPPQGKTGPLIGEAILKDYAQPSLPPENDLDLMAQLMNNFTLLVKSAAARPLSANEDWAAALCGRNPAQERFLPDHHPALNSRGQLVDRWGTPLFFHALGNGQFEIRSAGPDRKLWTLDDIHRNANGSFYKGAELASRTESRL
jgi:hypothetical protein